MPRDGTQAHQERGLFYFVDESGNTGLNLFDANQPKLYYGVLGARTNLDIVAEPLLRKLRQEIGVKRIHATELGVARLTTIAERITKFSKKNDLRFSVFTVNKPHHAIITYFDQVFDSGLNDALSWQHYFTPLRYPLLMNVATLFDEATARRAWSARREQNPILCQQMLQEVHAELLARLGTIPDSRMRELISGAIRWADANPDAISFGSSNYETTLQISPNLIGFQAVLQGIAIQSSGIGRKVRRITVDRQTEFNAAQGELAVVYEKMRTAKTFSLGPGMPEFDYSTLPTVPPTFTPGDMSPGLELVDISLWTAKRIAENRPVSEELRTLFWTQAKRGITDEVSLDAIDHRWKFLLDLPEPQAPLPESMAKALEEAERRRRAAVDGLGK